ncbi:DUF1624 domain-containing protein [Pyxidicoccus fallax]|uniref:DUF1624 domain-containing protein n=1 Tax=Pyxidicoccus fallax TaxID=394095 RepID=A0A848LW72_9BACT|nr:heparan-alpha-glucosaminide N-acetyltransferase domain-containing protein [Pyxidicoccus fallax]NMO22327.1 DUF1624 domain-containing protein [Pyxidicoccus fallax]NPC84033.1 DUF1624 domain-containing protein [Pyxidicoccus fallax]
MTSALAAGPHPETAAPHSARGGDGRLVAVDAARGLAMLLVFLAHFLDAYLRPLGGAAEALRQKLQMVTRLASPSFMLISGLILGLLYARRREDFGRLRPKLLRRGLLLLTVGHLLIVPTYLSWVDETSHLVRILFVTDTIGAALLMGPLLVPYLGARARLALGLGLFTASWALSLGVHSTGLAANLVEEVLFGHLVQSVLFSNFPLVPWFGVYLAGSAVGEWLCDKLRAGEARQAARRLVTTGGTLVTLGVVLVGIHVWLRRSGGAHLPEELASTLVALTSPRQKFPPGPAYLLFYGGLALAGLGLLIGAEHAGRLGRLLRPASLLGRHSFSAFLLQFYVYYLGVYYAHLPYSPLWPLLFVATVVLLGGLVWAWDVYERRPGAPARVDATPARPASSEA